MDSFEYISHFITAVTTDLSTGIGIVPTLLVFRPWLSGPMCRLTCPLFLEAIGQLAEEARLSFVFFARAAFGALAGRWAA